MRCAPDSQMRKPRPEIGRRIHHWEGRPYWAHRPPSFLCVALSRQWAPLPLTQRGCCRAAFPSTTPSPHGGLYTSTSTVRLREMGPGLVFRDLASTHHRPAGTTPGSRELGLKAGPQDPRLKAHPATYSQINQRGAEWGANGGDSCPAFRPAWLPGDTQ